MEVDNSYMLIVRGEEIGSSENNKIDAAGSR